ncbi:MAG TPA: DUF2182 domain-containing protein [Jatrophihabitans sp.]
MRGMDMGVATDLGSFGVFVAVWVPMMAAMMLPGAVPTVMRRAWSMSAARSLPLFVVTYVAVWAVVGIAVYLLYRPHGTAAAGVLVIATGVYELTPLKTRCRRRCRQAFGSGEFSLACVGSSIGMMVALVALGSMSVMWMVIIALVVSAQKILPAQRVVDVPFAFAIVALGVLILATPASIPGLVPSM